MGTAVHCKTQEQWDIVTENLSYIWKKGTWYANKELSCINIDSKDFGSINFCKEYMHYKIISFEEFCKLKNISMMKYKQGDVLVDSVGNKHKILGVCGEVYFVSRKNNFNVAMNCVCTECELSEYKLYQEPQVKELTIDEIAAKFGVKPEEIKIKK